MSLIAWDMIIVAGELIIVVDFHYSWPMIVSYFRIFATLIILKLTRIENSENIQFILYWPTKLKQNNH